MVYCPGPSYTAGELNMPDLDATKLVERQQDPARHGDKRFDALLGHLQLIHKRSETLCLRTGVDVEFTTINTIQAGSWWTLYLTLISFAPASRPAFSQIDPTCPSRKQQHRTLTLSFGSVFGRKLVCHGFRRYFRFFDTREDVGKRSLGSG